MKVLRLYDYLGQLKKELDVYVEGEDFKWTASYPEAVWLGTIAIEEAGKEPEPVELYVPVEEPTEPEAIEEAEVEPPAPFTAQLTTIEELSKLSRKDFLKLPMEERREILRKQVEEVTDEPEKVHRKRGRKSGSHPSDYLKSIKVVREDDSGADATKGD